MNLLLNLVARFLVAQTFILAGISKLGRIQATQAYMEHMGVPGALLPIVILTEIGAGLVLLLGYQTRLAALALAGFTVLAGFIFHFHLDDQMQLANFMKNLAITGGLLLFVLHGAGEASIDARRARRIAPSAA